MLCDNMIDGIIDIINKFIPDKDKQEEAKRQLIEAQIKANEVELDMLKTKMPLVDRMVTLTFPMLAYILGFGYLVDILFQVWSGIFGTEMLIINIPTELKELVTTYVVFFFGSRTIQRFADK